MSKSATIDIFKMFNIENAKDFKRNVEISLESDDKDLIGFKNDKMVLRNKITKESLKAQQKGMIPSNVIILGHSKTETLKNLNIYKKTGVTTTAPKKDQMTYEIVKKPFDTPDNKEVPGPKLIFDPKGKKFIYLNGQKLQIIKHSPNSLQTKVKDVSAKIPDITPKLPDSKALPVNKSGTKVEQIQSNCESIKNTDLQPNKNLGVKQPRTILPKLNGKILSINKSESSSNVTLVMKDMGGTLRLVNTSVLPNPGIPLIKEVSTSSASENKQQSVKVNDSIQMATSQCLCKKNQNSVSASTNTEQISSVNVGVQTESLPSENSKVENSLSELYTGGVIIGDDVNMGHGPPSIYGLNEEKMKLKFFKDLQRCLKWDSGNLPIHKGVMQQDLQEVKSQCIVLKARKAGVNIANMNNYTPLQLAVINNVNIEIVKILLQYDADMSVLDSEGNNVLHLAVEHNRNDLVRIFLNKIDDSKLDIDQFNYDGVTPLMMCAFHNDRIDMAEQFLQKNANLNLRDLKSGRNAIFHAAESHNASMVLLLLDYGADTKVRNFFGTSVHDAMFELEDIPKEIKYPILGRDLKVHEKRKLHQQKVKSFKRQKLEIVSTVQKLESRSNFAKREAEEKNTED